MFAEPDIRFDANITTNSQHLILADSVLHVMQAASLLLEVYLAQQPAQGGCPRAAWASRQCQQHQQRHSTGPAQPSAGACSLHYCQTSLLTF